MLQTPFQKYKIPQDTYNRLIQAFEKYTKEVFDAKIGNISFSKVDNKDIFILNVFLEDNKILVMGSSNNFYYYKLSNGFKKYQQIPDNFVELLQLIKYVNSYLIEQVKKNN